MREAEARRLLELVADCAAARDQAVFWELLLQRLRDLIPAEHATHHEFDPSSGSHVIRAAPDGALSPGLADALRPHAPESPLFRYHTQTLDGRAIKESDFLTRTAWRRLPIADVSRRAGAEERLAFVFIADGKINAIALNDRWGRFGEPERQLLDTVRRPLARAHATVVERERAAAVIAALGAAFDSADRAAAVLAADGSVEFISAAARELLRRYHAHEAALIGGCELLGRRNGRELRASRVSSDGDLVTVLLEEHPAPHPALTPRELEVLALVREGLTSAEIGARLYISTRTVERHLRNVYDKLGVRTRTGAVARAFGPH